MIKVLPALDAVHLQNLYVKSNKLESIEQFTTKEYPHLKTLNLSFNMIKVLPALDAVELE